MEEKDRSTSPIREEIQIISEDDRIRIPMDSAAKFVKRTYFGLFSIYASRDGANKNGEDEDGSKSKDEEKKKRIAGAFELVRRSLLVRLFYLYLDSFDLQPSWTCCIC